MSIENAHTTGPRRCSRGAILVEVLLATGLLGLVTGCLLTAFQQGRVIDRRLGGELQKLDEANRLVETLRADLLHARAFLEAEPPASGAASLMLLLGPSTEVSSSSARVVECRWEAQEGALLREMPGTDGRDVSIICTCGETVEFQLIPVEDAAPAVGIATPAPGPSAEPSLSPLDIGQASGPRLVKGVRVHSMTATQSDQPGSPARPGLDASFILPVPIPILRSEENQP